ncbi:MAG: ATP-binding protein [Candidatus Omnitrophota bacterium]|nr:ATP-binding protein [Candidatus Omnitrophota bacterium]
MENQNKNQEQLLNEIQLLKARIEELEKLEANAKPEAKAKLEEYSSQLEGSSRIKSDFTSMVSHELRTPLSAIKEGIAIVLDKTAGEINAEQKEFLEIAKRNVDRLTRLINDVLDFQKLESGRTVFNIEENDINEVVKEAQETMVPLAAEKGLYFILKLSEELGKIKFDKDRITQVLANLVNNAIKVTEKGGITVRTGKKDNAILVSVQDTGPGIKNEDIPQLFQRFVQLEKGIYRKPGGTGLGLAISKEIIAAHKGRIWAESEFGKGATFYFTLPVT